MLIVKNDHLSELNDKLFVNISLSTFVEGNNTW